MNRHHVCYKLTFYWGGGGTADVYMFDSAFFGILLFFVLPLRHKPWTGTHNQKRAPTQWCRYSTENWMLLIVDFGIVSNISVADFTAIIVDTPPPPPPPPPQPSPLLSASSTSRPPHTAPLFSPMQLQMHSCSSAGARWHHRLPPANHNPWLF